MTLQNGLLHQGEAFMWSDTGFWSESGKRVGSGCKAFAGQLWPWAGTFSGASPIDDPYRIVRLISELPAPTPAGLLNVAGTALMMESSEGRDCRLLLAFPCHIQGARLYHLAADEFPDRARFEPVMTSKFVCWGFEEEWYAPFRGRDLTPAEMRQVVTLQLHGNAAAMFELEVEEPVSDIIETRVGRAGVVYRQLRLIGGQLVEVPLGDGFSMPAVAGDAESTITPLQSASRAA